MSASAKDPRSSLSTIIAAVFHMRKAGCSYTLTFEMIVAVLVGLLACIPLVLTDVAARRGVLIAYLVLAVVLDAAFAFTASTGGAIRHTELLR